MGFRFYRRFRIAPGVTVNLGKRNASLSLGPRGVHVTLGTAGNRATVGVPGTGMYWTEKFGAPPATASNPPPAPPSTPTPAPSPAPLAVTTLDAGGLESYVEKYGRTNGPIVFASVTELANAERNPDPQIVAAARQRHSQLMGSLPVDPTANEQLAASVIEQPAVSAAEKPIFSDDAPPVRIDDAPAAPPSPPQTSWRLIDEQWHDGDKPISPPPETPWWPTVWRVLKTIFGVLFAVLIGFLFILAELLKASARESRRRRRW
jgi:hypothetical protein